MAISERLRVRLDQVVVGGGSLALLQMALTAFTGSGTEVVHAWRSYEAYPILIGIADAQAVPVPLDRAHRHDCDAMLAALTFEATCVEHGVSVRAFPGEGVRVTVGCPDAEAAVLAAVEEVHC